MAVREPVGNYLPLMHSGENFERDRGIEPDGTLKKCLNVSGDRVETTEPLEN